jgi:hypothetical protein
MGNKYDTVICDLGNVLINFDHRIAVRKILKHTSKAEDHIYDLFFDSRLTELYEEGRVDPSGFFSQVREALGMDMDSGAFFLIWNDIFF